MAKRNPSLALTRNEHGQISIFFSASLIVLISIVAFVINIGLFVKAKINLQNATDAAAFSGAAVQARQLSKIAYLNWEMRNIYKEWMYKYYVIGNLNIQDVENPNGSAEAFMKFQLRTDENVLTGERVDDKFNIPAVCIHIAGSKTNICKRYSVPGLPEFGSSNLPGAEEASRAFMDTLISTKVNDCIDRTRLNMLVANTWTYNVLGNKMDDSLAGRGPAILSDRQGAWPKAVELAIRMRNLEFIMNREAVSTGVCVSGSTEVGLTNCTKSINEFEQERKLGNERLIKAFYSGYRNLGNESDNEMKNSFTLTEIPPKGVKNDNQNNTSNLLIPSNRIYEKQFVDLKLMMINYAIFYAAMIPRADSATSGACDISKVAIPVPGYPLGFYKDPDVLTYYAVKGEAEFLGMFNPFNADAVKLTAYAAAKPMGGRIGPMLFIQRPNEDFIVGRTDNTKYRSVPYITSYNFDNVTVRGVTQTGDNFIPGVPLPTNSKVDPGSFWLESESSPLGGKLADAKGVQFGVPNMVYDYQVPFQITGYSNASKRINKITSANDTVDPIGLFSKEQFKKFRGSALNDTITPETLDEEIARVRAPTQYEAANYLIPTPGVFNTSQQLDSFGFVSGEIEPLKNGIIRYKANIYAPLYKNDKSDQVDLLYQGKGEAENAIYEFMRAQLTGMTKYKMSLNRAATSIFQQQFRVAGGAAGSAPGYVRAANGVSDIDFTSGDMNQTPKSCNSLAGQFLAFYYGGPVLDSEAPADNTNCPVPLGTLIQEYFAQTDRDASYDPRYYAMSLSWPSQYIGAGGLSVMTAYTPGPFTGVGFDGTLSVPISGGPGDDKMRRNTYATKLISLDSLQAGGGADYSNPQFSIYSEGAPNETTDDTKQRSFRNAPDPDIVGADLSSIKY